MAIQLKIGSIKAFAVASKRWNFNNVGVYIEVPLNDTSGVHAAWAAVALEKGMRSFFKTHLHGTHYNIVMQNFGLSSFDFDLVRGENGGYCSFLCEIRAKPHKVGQVTGLFLAALLKAPAATDRRHWRLKPYNLDIGDLNAIAHDFGETVMKKATIAFVAVREQSIRADWGEKAKKKFEQRVDVAAHFKALAKAGKKRKIEALPGDWQTVVVKPKSAYAALYTAQLFGVPVGRKGDNMIIAIDHAECLRDAKRLALRETMINMMTNDFLRAAKDDTPAIIAAMAVTAIASHAPLSYAQSILAGKKLPDAKALAAELAELFGQVDV